MICPRMTEKIIVYKTSPLLWFRRFFFLAVLLIFVDKKLVLWRSCIKQSIFQEKEAWKAIVMKPCWNCGFVYFWGELNQIQLWFYQHRDRDWGWTGRSGKLRSNYFRWPQTTVVIVAGAAVVVVVVAV